MNQQSNTFNCHQAAGWLTGFGQGGYLAVAAQNMPIECSQALVQFTNSFTGQVGQLLAQLRFRIRPVSRIPD